MKILQVTPFFKPMWESGGVTRVAYEISKQLSDMGNDITVYTTNRSKIANNLITNVPVEMEGFKVYYFENLRRYFPWKPLPILPYYLPFIAKKEIKNFDCIHIHDHRSLLAVIVYYYARKYNIPYVVQAHGSLPYLVGKGRQKKVFDYIIGKRILKYANKTIALNITEKNGYIALGVHQNKVEIVPNGINISDYNHLPNPGTFKQLYGMSLDDRIILYVGRPDPTKGVDLLIRSFADIHTQDKKVKLVIVGVKGTNLSFEKLVKSLKLEEMVIFTGFVSKEDKMAAYVDADVFVTPSFTGFPMTFLEACLCGTPIVTTDKGDFLDWINDEVGFVVTYEKEELKEAILKIIQDGSLRMRFSERGKELVQTRYNWTSIVQDIEKIYDDIQK
ncbi:glycosyl transferase family 1 [Methanocalculus chunghsingensis]|uniref:Glycosyl transferase family 1 n=1 Tax=Methanocalculus chunghsingensis TaxID=156457 RepID=A0A8J7W8G6_9EURY|nr:glycosyltransferase family 4 protein [Methanocalculus chunghsingensis]MBR1368255.1 glycosyl transferase family 1 [Methanocalculus chunghsingensis]